MKKKTLVLVTAVLVFTMACGGTINLGGDTPVPQQPPVQVPPDQAPPAQPATIQPPDINPPTVIPPTVSNPPMVAGTEFLDCLPYPKFGFLEFDGIKPGEYVPVFAISEPGLADPGQVWYQVKYRSFTCWVYSMFVTKSGDFSQLKPLHVDIPEIPKNGACDHPDRYKKFYPGVKVILPYSQSPWLGYTGWFGAMLQYSGHRTTVQTNPVLDKVLCYVVRVAYDDGQYAWRIRDLTIGGK